MKDKKGFISMSLVYAFLIVFLFLMLSIMTRYSEKINLLNAIDDKVNKDISSSLSLKEVIFNKILKDNIILSSQNIAYYFPSSSTNGNGFFYRDTTDGKRIYFYRGNVENNYLIFGREFDSATSTTSSKICWRILRSNSDGSIRLVYSGKANANNQCTTTDNYIQLDGIKEFSFNNSSDDNAYVGYTYGQSGVLPVNNNYQEARNKTHYIGPLTNSNAKNVIENWYKLYTNLAAYTNIFYTGTNREFVREKMLIEDSAFCSDRRVHSDSSGYGNAKTTYESHDINFIFTNGIAECSQEDTYSLSLVSGGLNSSAQGLNVPVGMLSVSDIVYAGGYLGNASDYFLNIGTDYWTMTPSYFDDNASLYYVYSNGSILTNNVTMHYALRPVISISGDSIVLKGIGTIDNPYIMEE